LQTFAFFTLPTRTLGENMSRNSLIKFAPLALTALVGTAFADDSSVTLYGILDVGIATIDKSANASETFPVTVDNNTGAYNQANLHRLTAMVNGPMSDSRWGIKGKEDLGGGQNAFFVLESGFNLPTGSINNAALSQIQAANGNPVANADSSLSGQLFNRAANVGLSDSSLGSIALGRNYAPGFDVIGAYDPQKGSQLFSPLGFSGSQGGALGLTEELRDDNSIRYENRFQGFNVRAIYKFGNIAGNNSAARGVGLNLGYETSDFGVQAVAQSYKDVVQTAGTPYTATNSTGLKGTLYDTSGWMVTGKYKIDALTLKLGYESYKRKGASDKAAALGGISELGYTFSTTMGNLADYSGQDKKYKLFWVGGDYSFTPTTNLALAYYNFKLDPFLSSATATSTVGNDQKETWTSLVLDHNLSKRTDVYAGFDHASMGGTYTTVVAHSQSGANVFGVGMRHRF